MLSFAYLFFYFSMHRHIKNIYLSLFVSKAKNWFKVLRLIERLDGPGSYFYIHVDARQSYLYDRLVEITRDKDNVRMVETRFTTIWGGSSLLSMLLTCISQLLLIKEWKWDFVLNLSESDYPVKTR